MSDSVRHPIQPIVKDINGTLRFKANAIVRYLLDFNAGGHGKPGHIDMNTLAVMDFSQEDREQFAQLIGYSLSGFGELSYVSNDTYETAANMAEKSSDEKNVRITYLEGILEQTREGLKNVVPTLFRVHPDDLQS
jgi:hypothetical protein